MDPRCKPVVDISVPNTAYYGKSGLVSLIKTAMGNIVSNEEPCFLQPTPAVTVKLAMYFYRQRLALRANRQKDPIDKILAEIYQPKFCRDIENLYVGQYLGLEAGNLSPKP